MALENLISIAFTPAELAAIDGALTVIETTIAGKVVNLTPEERQQYGRIGNRTENWIDKVKGYMDANPTLVPPYIDTIEHKKDFEARKSMTPRLNRITSVFEMLDDTQKLISSDLWTNSIDFYRNVKIASQQNVPGSTAIYQDLKAQFPGRPNTPPTP
ncbi:MAG: hypothetical protein JJE25_00510 [Bacteroidia bacterium]|nr:hypothetical protein [Bacteroidia bacterium]